MRLEKKIDGAVYYRECPKLDLACGRVLTKKLLQQGFLDFFGVEYLEGQVGRASGGKPYYGGFLDCAFNVSSMSAIANPAQWRLCRSFRLA